MKNQYPETQIQTQTQTTDNQPGQTEQNKTHKPPNLLQVIGSVLAGMFGVQSEAARQRDFSAGNIWVFIAVGVVMTLIFVLVLLWFVKGLVADAGV